MLLIGLVEDKHTLFITWIGDEQVGDHAELALATITGVIFARDEGRWRKWWKAQAGKMPRLTGENKGLIELERRNQAKGEKRQKEMRAKLNR